MTEPTYDDYKELKGILRLLNSNDWEGRELGCSLLETSEFYKREEFNEVPFEFNWGITFTWKSLVDCDAYNTLATCIAKIIVNSKFYKDDD